MGGGEGGWGVGVDYSPGDEDTLGAIFLNMDVLSTSTSQRFHALATGSN